MQLFKTENHPGNKDCKRRLLTRNKNLHNNFRQNFLFDTQLYLYILFSRVELKKRNTYRVYLLGHQLLSSPFLSLSLPYLAISKNFDWNT